MIRPEKHGRREFLRHALAATVGPSLLGAAVQEPHPAETLAGLRPPGQAGRGPIKIADIQAYAVKRAIFVKVTAEDGTAGWGEAGHSGGPLVAQLVNREVAPLLKGWDVFDADPAWSRMFFAVDELGPSGLAAQAIAGVDCALWDLRGHLLGLPVWKLLGGGYRKQIPLYGSFSRSNNDTEYLTATECARRAVELAEEGFRAIKVRLGIREENVDPSPDPAVPVVREIRRAIGDDVTLFVDANNGYSAAQAIRVGRILSETFNVALFEEPVAAYQYSSLASVSDALDVPIAAGEHEYTKWQFRDLILQGKVDVINPDVSKLAGLTEGMKVSALAETFDVPLAVHNARPTLLTAAHLHYVCASRMAKGYQEHPGSKRLAELWQFFEKPLEVRNGMAVVPDGPGLGLIPLETEIKRAALS